MMAWGKCVFSRQARLEDAALVPMGGGAFRCAATLEKKTPPMFVKTNTGEARKEGEEEGEEEGKAPNA
jgi:hypothetical protein